MEKVTGIKKIISDTLLKIGMHSHEAVDLIYHVGMAESAYRHITSPANGNPALSFWQVEPDTAKDTLDHFVQFRPLLIEKLKAVGFRWEQRADGLELEFQMKTNMAFAIALCRIKFWRDPAPLPKVGDIEAQAEYWKRIYNSEKGRGTVEHFCTMNGHSLEEKEEK